MAKKVTNIEVKDATVRTIKHEGEDFVCITDIARQKNSSDPNGVIANWMRNRNTIEFLGIWEQLFNPWFNPLEFEGFRKEAGLNAFTMSPSKWIESTNAKGLVAMAGRYGGTYARTDIAFEFASWISVEFKLYLVKEFQRLKEEEQKQIGWSVKRELSKLNYRIHTDAIKQNIVPEEIDVYHKSLIYAEEADVLKAASKRVQTKVYFLYAERKQARPKVNVAMFGMTAKEWREANPELKGNIRDYATINELICLSNMENINAVLINDGMPQGERLVKLNQIAIQQMQVLEDNESRKLLK